MQRLMYGVFRVGCIMPGLISSYTNRFSKQLVAAKMNLHAASGALPPEAAVRVRYQRVAGLRTIFKEFGGSIRSISHPAVKVINFY